MYKFDQNPQLEFNGFNQVAGLELDKNNRWVVKASQIPWQKLEEKYAMRFSNCNGAPAKPFRLVFGSLIVQSFCKVTDRELVLMIQENPYIQFFLGFSTYQNKQPFSASLLVSMRKRFTQEDLAEINELIIQYTNDLKKKSANKDAQEKVSLNETKKTQDTNHLTNESAKNSTKRETEDNKKENRGTLIIDATCVPHQITYPLDAKLINTARCEAEKLVKLICKQKNEKIPRTYGRRASKEYLEYSKKRKKTQGQIRKIIKSQLQYLDRNLRRISNLTKESKNLLTKKQQKKVEVLKQVYAQQKQMYENKVHSVENRIVSIDQPFLRPIVRGKEKAPVEFGAKVDFSLDEDNNLRLEKLSYDAYNESENLIDQVEAYKDRAGVYPERVLADKIYRNRKNLKYCKDRNIRLLGPALGRPKADDEAQKNLKKIEKQDNKDRISIERSIGRVKGKFGLNKIRTKLKETSTCVIGVATLCMNLF